MANYDAQAQATFKNICSVLDSNGLQYHMEEDELKIFLSATGEDLPISVLYSVNTQKKVLALRSLLDVEVENDKKAELAVAVNVANFALVNGAFEFDISTNTIMFSMAQPYFDDPVSEKVISHMTSCLFAIVDEYNERFLMLNKGMINLAKFIDLANS